MTTAVAFDVPRGVFECVSAGRLTENDACLCAERGVVHSHAAFGDDDAPPSDDVENERKCRAIPYPSNLGVGRCLVLRWVGASSPDELADVQDLFRIRWGAYARVENLFASRTLSALWPAYEAKNQRLAWRDDTDRVVDLSSSPRERWREELEEFR